MTEVRWYKGKYRVEIVLKSKGNYRVRALQEIPLLRRGETDFPFRVGYIDEGTEFTTVPRLLWRHPRK